MGNKIAFPKDRHVLIVGGGYGGSNMANILMKENAKFTVVDTRDHMHHNMASLRAVIQPGFVPRTMVPFKPAFGDHYKHGKVVNISPSENQVELQTGERLKYDVLVLATGTTGPFPCKLRDHSTENASQMYENLAQKVKECKSVLVVGGGAAGVEMAGEIASEYPDKKVTLVHSHKTLLNYPKVTQAFQDKLVNILKGFNINLVLGSRVKDLNTIKEEGAAGTVTTEAGDTMQADLVLKATGLHVNSDAYKNSVLKDQMAENGTLKVDSHLKVVGYKNIYAIGDCNNTPENKLAFLAEAHSAYVVKDIKNEAAGKQLVEYKIGSLPMATVLALGRTVGMAQLTNGWSLPDFMANRMKAGNMFVDSIWKRFHQTPPPEK